MVSEFDIIRRFFSKPSKNAVLGVGDDAAIIAPTPGTELVVAADMLVVGRHFFPDADPYKLGKKSLAVNLSDMAAMGATPKWALLSIGLPGIDEAWLREFSRGFFDIAQQYKVDLIGGDTTRAQLTLSVQIIGEVATGKALRRTEAQVGDEIWVSGTLGDAALVLAHMQHKLALTPQQVAHCLPALHTPIPRVELGQYLIGLANSAIDISDGLSADLGHILEASNVSAKIELSRIPISEVMQQQVNNAVALDCLLAGGDDYELCFTVPAKRHGEVIKLSDRLHLPLTCIGYIEQGSGLRYLDEQGKEVIIGKKGFDHFA